MSSKEGMTLTGFSIVVCTHNGASRLLSTLSYVVALHVPVNISVELIVVNNASTDDTEKVVQESWVTMGAPFPLVLLRESRSGKGYAVETGYDAANYSHILTVDDDNWLAPDYLTHAAAILMQHPDVGILQGHSTGVFETTPPAWVERYEEYFIIGGPVDRTGYFPPNNFYVWGAGMIIQRSDWVYLRNLGFSFLTSKIPGKAAGEDNEIALALVIMGRKIYYSDKLRYQHFMPSDRMVWEKLRKNFETFGYVSHYFILYSLVVESHQKSHGITGARIRRKFLHSIALSDFTWKQHLCYWFKPLEEWYQLELVRYHSRYKWHWMLLSRAKDDVKSIQRWMIPLLDQSPASFKWPV